MDSFKDEQLVIQYREGNALAFHEILTLYTPLIYNCCRRFFAPGLQREDLFQEGCIGLYYAVGKYRRDGGASFKTIARLYIQNQIINAVKSATRKKQRTLNDSFSLHAILPNDYDEVTYFDIVPSSTLSPEEIVIRCEEEEERKQVVKQLAASFSPIEKKVFLYYMKGFTYKEIAQKAGTGFKTVDNAIRRIKIKVRR